MQVEVREMTFMVQIVKFMLEYWVNLGEHCNFHPAFKPMKPIITFLQENKFDKIIFKCLI